MTDDRASFQDQLQMEMEATMEAIHQLVATLPDDHLPLLRRVLSYDETAVWQFTGLLLAEEHRRSLERLTEDPTES